MLAILAATMLLAVQSGPDVGSGPEPAPYPISWEFRFEYLTPRRIEVQLAGQARPQVFWYLVYTVTNVSSTTQRFFPTIQLVTEDLKVIDTDVGISPLVFAAIRERHKQTHPDLVHPTEVIGELRSGEGYARQSVAIWRSGELPGNRFRVYVAGTSGEARVVANPAFDPQRPETQTVRGEDGREREVAVNPRYFTLRKTLELTYLLPGSEHTRHLAEPVLERSRWVMR